MTNKSQEILNQLVSDYKSGLLPDDRKLSKGDISALIYNLFNGTYQFSYKQYKEILNHLINYENTK